MKADSRYSDLEQSVAVLEAQRCLNDAADEALEVALRERLSLAETMTRMFPLLLEHTGGKAALLRTWDEELAVRELRWPDGSASDALPPGDEIERRCVEGGELVDAREGLLVVGRRLDVAGQPFGVAALLAESKGARSQAELAALLKVWCEQLDDYLAAIAQARHKHRIVGAIAQALKDPVLDEGIEQAIAVLSAHVPFDDLALVFRHDEDPQGPIHYRILRGGVVAYDSRHPDPEMDRVVREHALVDGDPGLAEQLGLVHRVEEVLIHGLRDEHLVGRLLIGRRDRRFHTFDRDLLQRFSDFLCQRIVDFNREWKELSSCFAPAVVARLLAEEDYAARFLAPVERDVAVMYADISGFTRISEQVLRKPSLIGRFVDSWSREAVKIIWETGGVFDKMVGDCLIGLWGPPFHDIDARTACRRALEAAKGIRDLTRSLGARPELPVLDPPPGVSTGLNWCSMFVGRFGPNDDYTGFSSGMNNTARLQGVAVRDEILCMESFVEAIRDPSSFGEARSAPVKNVAEPLCFRALL